MGDPLSICDAKSELIAVSRLFYQNGWMPGTAGNLSIRVSPPHKPLEYVITASGVDKGQIQSDQLLLTGAGATCLEPTSYKTSAETLLHEMLYRHFDTVGAVYHVHTPVSTVLSLLPNIEKGLVFSGLELLKGLGETTHETAVTLPVYPNDQDMPRLVKLIEPTLSQTPPGFLLAGHGVYAWGRTPFEAKRHVEIWEFLFQTRYLQHPIQR